jgi:signal transduction histidine kinase
LTTLDIEPGAGTPEHWSAAVDAALSSSQSAAQWYAVFDRSGRCLVSRRGRLGPLPEQILGMGESSQLESGDSRRILAQVIESGRAQDFRQLVADARFGPRIFEFNFRPLTHRQRVFGALVQSTECTGRRSDAAASRLHGSLLEAMDDAVLLTDASHLVQLANPAAEKLFQSGENPLVGAALRQLHPSLEDSAAQALSRTGNGSVAHSPEICVGHTGLDGLQRLIACRSTPVAVGDRWFAINVLRDVTEEARLRQQRGQLTRDLHDGLGQELTGVSLLLRALGNGLRPEQTEQLELVESLMKIVSQMLDETRALASGAAPVRMPWSGLPPALQQLAKRSAMRPGVDVRFESTVLAAWPADRGDATELFRIAQEATTNALRHAAARRIHIRLTVAADSLTLSVDDDGIGFDPAAVAGVGSGLRNLQTRAEAIGASLLLRSAPGRGTYIECVLPRAH